MLEDIAQDHVAKGLVYSLALDLEAAHLFRFRGDPTSCPTDKGPSAAVAGFALPNVLPRHMAGRMTNRVLKNWIRKVLLPVAWRLRRYVARHE